MKVQSSGSGVDGVPLDLNTIVTVRAWSDEHFAARLKADPRKALIEILENQGLDVALADTFVGDIAQSPLATPGRDVPVHAGGGSYECPTNYVCDVTQFCNTNFCWEPTEAGCGDPDTYFCATNLCPDTWDCEATIAGPGICA